MATSSETTELEIDLLDRAAKQAATRDLRTKILKDRKEAIEPALPAVPIAPRHPDDNPEWQEEQGVGINYAPMGARRALARAVEEGKSLGGSALDEIVRQARVAGMSPLQIGLRYEMSEDSVNDILRRLREKSEQQTPTEIRYLQTQRVEAIINALWNMVTNGSVEHIELALKAIERLNKMYELESEKVKIELDYVTDQSAELMYRSIQMAVTAIVEVYEKKLAQAGQPAMDPEIIEGTIGEALDSAANLILDAQSNPLVLERQGKEMVLISGVPGAKM